MVLESTVDSCLSLKSFLHLFLLFTSFLYTSRALKFHLNSIHQKFGCSFCSSVTHICHHPFYCLALRKLFLFVVLLALRQLSFKLLWAGTTAVSPYMKWMLGETQNNIDLDVRHRTEQYPEYSWCSNCCIVRTFRSHLGNSWRVGESSGKSGYL